MLFRRSRLRKTRTSRYNNERNRDNSEEEAVESSLVSANELTGLQDLSFSQHISSYIGQTVTIFTESGGQAGMGFTGILLGGNNIFIRIILIIGSPPSCSLGNSCGATGYYYSQYDTYQGYYPSLNTVGAVADIPIRKIAAFVHNAI